MLNWDETDLQQDFEKAGFTCSVEVVKFDSEMTVSPAMLQQWLGEGSRYGDRLIQHGISPADIEKIQQLFRQQLSQKTVTWTRSIAFIEATLS